MSTHRRARAASSAADLICYWAVSLLRRLLPRLANWRYGPVTVVAARIFNVRLQSLIPFRRAFARLAQGSSLPLRDWSPRSNRDGSYCADCQSWILRRRRSCHRRRRKGEHLRHAPPRVVQYGPVSAPLLPKAATCSRTASRLRRLLVHRAAANRATTLTQASSPAIPIEHDSKSRHFHGQVRRFAHDKSDRLRALPCLLRGPAL